MTLIIFPSQYRIGDSQNVRIGQAVVIISSAHADHLRTVNGLHWSLMQVAF